MVTQSKGLAFFDKGKDEPCSIESSGEVVVFSRVTRGLEKMTQTVGTISSICIFISLIAVGSTIKCFQCNSAFDKQCEDIIANDTASSFYKSCNGTYGEQKPFCRKIQTIVGYENSNRLVRDCGWINESNKTEDFCQSRDTDFVKRMSCVCFTEGCNPASRSAVLDLATLFCAVLLLSFPHFY
ncbi:hypothetical protein JTB14_013065 [Gonioctena quinquepunctata]|nr:hypothetical protein JTB14_013065 [Gonioctena quinquepunctata]